MKSERWIKDDKEREIDMNHNNHNHKHNLHKNRARRALALLLATSVCPSIVQVPVLAEEEDEPASLPDTEVRESSTDSSAQIDPIIQANSNTGTTSDLLNQGDAGNDTGDGLQAAQDPLAPPAVSADNDETGDRLDHAVPFSSILNKKKDDDSSDDKEQTAQKKVASEDISNGNVTDQNNETANGNSAENKPLQ